MTRPDDSIHPEVSYHEANLLHAWRSGEYSYDCQWQKKYSPAGRNHIPYIYSVATFMRMVTRLPPMGSPTKSRRRYPFFTIERAPQEGQQLIRSFYYLCILHKCIRGYKDPRHDIGNRCSSLYICLCIFKYTIFTVVSFIILYIYHSKFRKTQRKRERLSYKKIVRKD